MSVLGLSFSSQSHFYCVSIGKTTTNIGTLIQFISISSAIGLYLLYISHTTWNTAFMTGLESLITMQICRINYRNWCVGELVLHLYYSWTLGLLPNVASLRYSYRCLSELVELAPLPYYCERPTYNANTFIYFLLPFWDIIRIFISAVSFLPLVDFVTLCLQKALIWLTIWLYL